MAYTPDATDVTNPAIGSVKAATAAAEFIAIKLYMRDVLLAGINSKAAIASPNFTGADGANVVTATGTTVGGSVSLRPDGTNGNAIRWGGSGPQAGTLRLLGPGDVERLRVDAAGNLGLGAPPVHKFDVQATVASALTMRVANGSIDAAAISRITLDTQGGGWSMDVYRSGGAFALTNGGAERLRVDPSGNLGVAVASPTSKLHVNGSFALSVPVYVSTSTYTVGATDSCLRVAADCTITLPAASNFNGRLLRIANIGAVSVTSASSNVGQQISGTAGTAIVPAIAGKWVDLQSDGTYWYITAAN